MLHLLVNQCNHNDNKQKGGRACFHSNAIFFLLEKARVIVHPWCVGVNSPMGAFEWII